MNEQQQLTPRPPMPISRLGLEMRTLDDVWRFATCLAKSGLAPKGIESPEAIVIAVQMGMEVGLPPMAALQNIAVINGRPSLWGDAMLAVVRATGELEEFNEWFEQEGERINRTPSKYGDDTTAVCHVKRRGSDALPDVAFSVADAKRANLWAKQGPWSQYPSRMLKFRARAFALRDAFGDALRGMLSTEEAQDIAPKEVKGSVVEAARPQLFSPPAATAEITDNSLGGGNSVIDDGAVGTETAAEVKHRGWPKGKPRGPRQPAPEKPEPPDSIPFTLDDTPDPAAKARELKRMVREAGVEEEAFDKLLARDSYPPLSMLAESESAEVIENFDEMMRMAKEEALS
jgi:hypothetical protein